MEKNIENDMGALGLESLQGTLGSLAPHPGLLPRNLT